MVDIRHRMAELHETRLAERFGGRKSRGSGNQHRDPLDGRQDHHEDYMAFAWDGKSTFGAGLTVTRKLWEKTKEDSHNERPMLGLMFYRSGRLDIDHDLVVLDADDAEELNDRSRRLSEIEDFLKAVKQGRCTYPGSDDEDGYQTLTNDLLRHLDG